MSESASLRARDSSRENTDHADHPGVRPTGHQDWANFSSAQQTRVRNDNAAYIKGGILPDTQLASSASSHKPEDVLSDANASAQQKLQTVEALAASGKDHVTVTDKDGTKRELRLELEHQGNKTLVHMYADEGGKERVLLRGVDNGNGTFSHEKDGKGNDVGFNGSWWSQHMSNKSSLGGTGDSTQVGDKSQIADGGSHQGHQGHQGNGHHGRGHHGHGHHGQSQQDSPTPPSGRPNQITDNRPNPPSDGRPDQSPDTSADVGRLPSPEAGSMDRSQFDAQLKDPRVMAAFAGRMASEVGTQGPAAQLAFAEEVMNRAAAGNKPLMQALSGSYYPTPNPGSSHNPKYIAAITKAWQEGTDTTHGATGNASGTVGFGVRGGYYDSSHHWVSPNQTASIGGERFGYEQADLKRGWLDKYQQLKNAGSIASRARSNDGGLDA